MARKAKATVSKDKKLAATAARHERFAREYVIDYNGTRAYKAVYGQKLADDVAAVNASRLLRDAQVAGLVEQLEAEHVEALGLRAHRILREAARLAFIDPGEVMGEAGTLLEVDAMPADVRAAVASVEVFEEYQGKGEAREYIGRTKKLKFWDKNAAIEKLMKHAGLFKADNTQRADVIRQFMEQVSGKSRGLPGRYQPKGA